MKTIRIASLTIATGLICACTASEQTGNDAPSDVLGPGEIAFINGNRIPESVFRVFTLNAVQANPEDLTEEGRAELIDRLIYFRLLADAAQESGLHEEAELAAELELVRLQLLARAMTDRYAEDNPPSASELRDLYEENLPRLAATQYKTRHILVETEAEAAALLEQLSEGADFAELAREHSTGPTGPDGGDLEWISAQSVVEPFGNAMENSTPGEPYPQPVETQYGWHVILVEDVEEGVGPGLDAVRQDLIVAAEARKLDAYLEELREAAEITIVE